MKDIIGFIVLIFCFLLAFSAFIANDGVVGLVSFVLFLIGGKIFKY